MYSSTAFCFDLIDSNALSFDACFDWKFSTSKASNQDRVQESRQGSGRAELIKAAFRALNVSGSGYLSAAEMKPFAEATGISAVIKLCHYIIAFCVRLWKAVCTCLYGMFLYTWALASG